MECGQAAHQEAEGVQHHVDGNGAATVERSPPRGSKQQPGRSLKGILAWTEIGRHSEAHIEAGGKRNNPLSQALRTCPVSHSPPVVVLSAQLHVGAQHSDLGVDDDCEQADEEDEAKEVIEVAEPD